MGLWVLSQGLIEELDATSCPREFFQQHHLMDVIARQTVRTRDQHPVNCGLLDSIPQAIEPWPVERGTTIPIITENILWTQGLTLRMDVRGETFDLLFNGLSQGLPFGRHPDIDRYAHVLPPSVVCEMVRAWRTALGLSSIEAGIGTPDPIAVPRLSLAGIADVAASGVSWLPSR
jgi:hypothetical protein